ncbi:MAG: FAD-binding protein [Sellimonas intestinalis]
MNREVHEEKLRGCMERERVKVQEPMAKHTTFRLGGTADYYVMPKSEEEIRALISLCKREEVPYYIVGNGSNLLVSDAGYRGVIIAIGRKWRSSKCMDVRSEHRPGL